MCKRNTVHGAIQTRFTQYTTLRTTFAVIYLVMVSSINYYPEQKGTVCFCVIILESEEIKC